MNGTEIRLAKIKLQDGLFNLIAAFESEWGVSIADVTLHKAYRIGGEVTQTTTVEVRVEV
jgi:hypothetical protein